MRARRRSTLLLTSAHVGAPAAASRASSATIAATSAAASASDARSRESTRVASAARPAATSERGDGGIAASMPTDSASPGAHWTSTEIRQPCGASLHATLIQKESMMPNCGAPGAGGEKVHL